MTPFRQYISHIKCSIQLSTTLKKVHFCFSVLFKIDVFFPSKANYSNWKPHNSCAVLWFCILPLENLEWWAICFVGLSTGNISNCSSTGLHCFVSIPIRNAFLTERFLPKCTILFPLFFPMSFLLILKPLCYPLNLFFKECPAIPTILASLHCILSCFPSTSKYVCIYIIQNTLHMPGVLFHIITLWSRFLITNPYKSLYILSVTQAPLFRQRWRTHGLYPPTLCCGGACPPLKLCLYAFSASRQAEKIALAVGGC